MQHDPKLTRSALLDTAYQSLDRQIADHTFTYDGTKVVALKIGQRTKTPPKSVPVCIIEPHDLFEFLTLGGSPAVWMRKFDKTLPVVMHSLKINRTIFQINLGRFIAHASDTQIAKYINQNSLDLRACNIGLEDAGIREWRPHDPREILREHSKVMLYPEYDLASRLVRPERLDLDDPFRLDLY